MAKTGTIYFDSSNSVAATVNEWRVYTEEGATEPLATDPFGSQGVWSGYEQALHMNQDPSVSSILDSSVRGNDMTVHGGMTNSDLVPGKAGNAIEFDGVDDYANNLSPSMDFSSGEATVSLWVFGDSTAMPTSTTPFQISGPGGRMLSCHIP